MLQNNKKLVIITTTAEIMQQKENLWVYNICLNFNKENFQLNILCKLLILECQFTIAKVKFNNNSYIHLLRELFYAYIFYLIYLFKNKS